jgi:hypothetical protein
MRFLDQHAAIAALALQQHAVFGLDQLVALGLSPRAVQARAAAGRLHRIHRAVYSLVPRELLNREGLWMAAVLACGPEAVLSHRSAAALHELQPAGGTRIDVTVPGRSSRSHGGVTVHRSTTLADRDVTRVENIPCTTVARTQFDLAEVLSRRRVERAFDQAEILELFDLRQLHDQLSRNSRRHGVPVVRAVLEKHYPGSTPTWSDLEEAFLALVREAGLPEPEVNAWVDPGDGGPPARVDFLWRPQRVIVQTDGHRFHRTRQAFERDRRLDQRLTVAGYRPVRVTWRQVESDRRSITRTLVALVNPQGSATTRPAQPPRSDRDGSRGGAAGSPAQTAT